jgi:hypothetical protein
MLRSRPSGIPAKASRTLNFTNLYTNKSSYHDIHHVAWLFRTVTFKFIWPLPIEEINNNPTLRELNRILGIDLFELV